MNDASPYDALLLVSFGGPEGMAEVSPFLDHVLRGRNVPPERRREVAHHYERFAGVSPINAQNRALLEALRIELEAHGPRLPLYWGNRHWHPFLADTLRAMARDGVRRVLAFVTSAYSSYSGCRQYLEDIARLGVLANQPASARTDLDRAGITALCDGVWLSEAVGLAKPDPAFFRLGLDAWVLAPDRVAYVGDRPDNDVAPAKALGLVSVRVRRGPHADQPARSDAERPDIEAHDLEGAARHLFRWRAALGGA